MAQGTRTLYVLRHAKSSWDQPVPDHERSLAPRGSRALEHVAVYLDEHAVRPDVVLCSTARRAVETLEPLLPVLGDPEVSTEDDLYGASGSEVLARLHQVNKRTASVMVIGHNPGLQDLVLSLASTGSELDSVREKFPTAALATLEFDRPWGELGPGCARVTAFVRPRDLRGV